MNSIIDMAVGWIYFAAFIVGVLAPLAFVLLPVFAYARSRKWLPFVAFQALASLLVWGFTSAIAAYFLVLNAASMSFALADDAIQRSAASYTTIVVAVGVPYILIIFVLALGLVYGIKAQGGWKK